MKIPYTMPYTECQWDGDKFVIRVRKRRIFYTTVLELKYERDTAYNIGEAMQEILEKGSQEYHIYTGKEKLDFDRFAFEEILEAINERRNNEWIQGPSN